jgi:hypothetical protein
MLLSNEKFKLCLETKYGQDFDQVEPEKEIIDMFHKIAKHIDVDIYIRLLSYIDLWDYENFQRFFYVSIRNHYNQEYNTPDIESIKHDLLLQILCLVCLQYYFL